MNFQTFFVLACSLSTALALEIPDWKQTIYQSQLHLAQAEPEKAEAGLIELERTRPEIRREPFFCYQRFFVALEGLGDRATAKLMLQRLNHLVASDALDANSTIYLSVTEAWHRALFHSDSDLIRLAHKKMTERLAHNTPVKP